MIRRFFFAGIFLTGQAGSADNLKEVVAERYKPRSDAHAVQWDYTFFGAYQGAGLRVAYSFSSVWAYRIGGRTLYTLDTAAASGTKYLFSLQPTSEILLRYPEIISNLWRPYFASELNLHYHLTNERYLFAFAGRSGVEFFASQNFSVAAEIGINLPFYRNDNAPLTTGGTVSIIGGYYF